MDLEHITPETKLSDLTAGDLMDLIGWALTRYRAGEQGDVSGFTFSGHTPVLLPLNPSWDGFNSKSFARRSAGRTQRPTA